MSLLDSQVVGISLQAWRSSEQFTDGHPRDPFTLYRKAVWFRANPRSPETMRELLHEYRSEAVVIGAAEIMAGAEVPDRADQVILLYQDAIGLGWAAVERRVLDTGIPRRKLFALTGRGRLMRLDRYMRFRLVVRRFLARSFVPEVAATVLVATFTLPLVLIDWLRGRR